MPPFSDIGLNGDDCRLVGGNGVASRSRSKKVAQQSLTVAVISPAKQIRDQLAAAFEANAKSQAHPVRASRMRTNCSGPGSPLLSIPIVLLPAESPERQRRIGASVGCSGYLTKPVPKSNVLKALRYFSQPPMV